MQNIFGFHDHSSPISGPRRSDASVSERRGNRWEVGAHRDWSGTRPRQTAASLGGRAVCEIFAYAVDKLGRRKPCRFGPPELVTPARADWLVEKGFAAFYPMEDQS